jgi:hypothetical protein
MSQESASYWPIVTECFDRAVNMSTKFQSAIRSGFNRIERSQPRIEVAICHWQSGTGRSDSSSEFRGLLDEFNSSEDSFPNLEHPVAGFDWDIPHQPAAVTLQERLMEPDSVDCALQTSSRQ